MAIDSIAERGFTAGADAYAKARPDYPDDCTQYVIQALGIGRSSVVADIGAGTGKFTQGLVPSGARIIAVEPLDAMRAKLESALPSVETVAASAEALPFADASIDAIVCAQAFHWFEPHAALGEFHRVLKPGGRLALLWNLRDERIAWMSALEAIIHAYETITPHRDLAMFNQFVRGQFTSPAHREFANAQDLDEAGLVTRIASISFIATLPQSEQERVFARVRALVHTHPDTKDVTIYRFAYRLHVYVSERAATT